MKHFKELTPRAEAREEAIDAVYEFECEMDCLIESMKACARRLNKALKNKRATAKDYSKLRNEAEAFTELLQEFNNNYGERHNE